MRVHLVLSCLLLGACAATAPRIAELPVRDPSECGPRAVTAKALDVAVAIDGSRSTALPSGSDIDGDGEVGAPWNVRSTDPLDTILAAQVVGVRSLVRALAGSDVRFSIVGISGRSLYPEGTQPMGRVVAFEQGRIASTLTDDETALERGLDRVLATRGEGRTDFAAGMSLALRTLERDADASGEPRGVVFFLTDSSTPVVAAPKRYPYPFPDMVGGAVDFFDPLMRQEARRAQRDGVTFHTFAIGPAARAPQPHALTRIAGATGGSFRAIDDPVRLHCELLDEVARLSGSPSR
jgi:hypothetical protein